MKKGLVGLIGLWLAVAILLSVSIILAQHIMTFSFHNNYGTGSVCVAVEQFQIDKYGNRAPATSLTVLPGQELSYIAQISNERADCYVRLHLSVLSEDKEMWMSAANVLEPGDNWRQINDELYYTKVLKHGEASDAFRAIRIPSSWSQEKYEDKKFTLSIHADAIQAVNFEPDFSSEMPWGSVIIEEAKEYDPIDYCEVAHPYTSTNELEITNECELQSNASDLFANFSYFMAGDNFEDDLHIKNSSGKQVKIYFRIRNREGELNGKTRMIISCDNRTCYRSGDVANDHSWHELTGIPRFGSKDLSFSIYLPENSRGEYSVLSDSTEWEFMAVESHEMSGDMGVILTGDYSRVFFWLYLMLLGLIVIAIVIELKGKNEE